jgi:hypothetical protein
MVGESQSDNKPGLLSRTESPLPCLALSLSRKRVARFLEELANSPRPEDRSGRAIRAGRRAARHFPEFSPTPWERDKTEAAEPDFPADLGGTLRVAWEKRLLREREAWLSDPMETALHRARVSHVPEEAEKWRRVAAAFLRGLTFSNRLCVCGNPECPAPYFVATKKNQRYCSEKCAGWAKREAKKAWWDQHGSERRRSERKERPISKERSKRGK